MNSGGASLRELEVSPAPDRVSELCEVDVMYIESLKRGKINAL